jgi:hypothetical protein
MNETIEKFISETIEQFRFLENKNGFKVIVSGIENGNYFPDSEAVVKYVSSKVEIKVFWYFASAVIGVVFVELKDGKYPNNKVEEAKTINLYSLVNFLFPGENELFLLKDTNLVTMPKIKKREKIINDNMHEVISNLSLAVKKYASTILLGDTSIFDDVMKYQVEVIKKQYNKDIFL